MQLRLVMICLTITLLFTIRAAASPYTAEELLSGYITIVDEQGAIVFQTGLAVHPGDEFISEDNKLYEVTTVEGNLARSRYTRDEKMASLLDKAVIPVQGDISPPPRISIYHTHTDESFIPTDGTSTQPGNGSIMKVGDAFDASLTALGYQVDHSITPHDPHDANAYQRSRRTFMKLLELQPAALFDLHRDSAPLPVYQTTINGQDAAKILLVVGRQNQNRATTMNYAKTIKAATDSKYRGLIRGIFIAHGNYNQDLNPRAMLIEIGTQYNRREAAEYSAGLLAEVIPAVLTATAGHVAEASPLPGSSSLLSDDLTPDGWGRDLAFLIGAVIAGSAAFLFLSTGSVREAKQKLRNFTTREWNDLFRLRRKRKN